MGQIWFQIIGSAKAGQRLPQMTVLFLFHSLVHVLFFELDVSLHSPSSFVSVSSITLSENISSCVNSMKKIPFTSSPLSSPVSPAVSSCFNFRKLSLSILFASLIVNIAGYTLLVLLYRHSVQTIFNKHLPPTLDQCIPSFGAHLSLLRPLEVLFRYCTSSHRVLPDILVLGEVRCGTTTLCHHLSSSLQDEVECIEPFCLWAHPVLDGKETFYFVGHYLGYVTPSSYGMCFPLKITKWWHETKKRRCFHHFHVQKQNQSIKTSKPFVTFDGCAQYLTSPTAPYLIAEAYRAAKQPPPVLVACVRNPVDQARSWWRYENDAMEWGTKGMQLETRWNTEIRGDLYPPRTISKALDFSGSEFVSELYEKAEELIASDNRLGFDATDDDDDDDDDGSDNGEKFKRRMNGMMKLPPWAMTWPAGQLGSIGRNGNYASNISRFERVFASAFQVNRSGKKRVVGKPERDTTKKHPLIPTGKTDRNRSRGGSKLEYVTVVPMEDLSDEESLKEVLATIMEKVGKRREVCEERSAFREAADRIRMERKRIRLVRRNANSLDLKDMEENDDEEERYRIARHFSDGVRELEDISGMKFNWLLS